MIPVKHIDPDDIALYAMHLLPPDETEEMTMHLQHSSEGRRVLSEIYADLSLYAQTAEMHSPPALARQRLMKHVAREKKPVPIDRFAQTEASTRDPTSAARNETRVKRSAPARVLPWVGWAIAAGLGLFAADLYQQRDHLNSTLAADRTQIARMGNSAAVATTLMETFKDPGAVHVTLTGTDQRPPPAGRLSYITEKGSLVLMASNLEPLQPYKTYELWLIPADGRDPIAAGTFRPDARGNASVVLPVLPRGVAAKAFGVTIEDGEGGPVPTMPIVLKGAVT